VSARLARWATALAVLAVATIAGIVSYSHVESLGLGHGYSLSTARLLPLSVDGLVIASAMALATGTRTALARFGLVLGIVATVTANAVYGASHGPVGVVVNMWPAVAFLVSSEILIGMLRARPGQAPEAVADTMTVPLDVTGVAPVDVPADVSELAAGTVLAGTVYPVPVTVPRTVAARQAPTRTRAERKPSPEKIFAAEIAQGGAPSLRSIKERCHVGTDNARAIREQLLAVVGGQADVPQAA
jgi:hypothetical protein